ncbi:helix-turn-helix domain-containing protein [Tsukamurella soli]|uniref:helix-turn-helix domain-containing protein n=1 Tax=Tsukamurella soli TaxID=644556 RepID=UPI00360B69BF
MHAQLHWVREHVGMTAYFCVPGEGGLLCLGQVAGAVVDMLDLGPGRILPPDAGAAAHALTLPTGREWSVDDGEVTQGIASVAVPVRRDDGDVVGVIAVAGLRASVLPQAESAAQSLTVAARALGESMSRPRSTGQAAARRPEPAARTSAPAPALILKAGALMNALAEERIATSARLTELTDEPVSSVYRMLATLTEIGWVEQISPAAPTASEEDC